MHIQKQLPVFPEKSTFDKLACSPCRFPAVAINTSDVRSQDANVSHIGFNPGGWFNQLSTGTRRHFGKLVFGGILYQFIAPKAQAKTVPFDTQTPSSSKISALSSGDDATAVIQEGLNSAKNGVFVLSNGVYNISPPGLLVPSGLTFVGQPGAILRTVDDTPFAMINVLASSNNIILDGLVLSGPWSKKDFPKFANQKDRSIFWRKDIEGSIGIDVQGVWRVRHIAGRRNDLLQTPAPSKKITIKNCTISGFGESGLLIDNVTTFNCISNTIARCGRDGVRMYGVQNGVVRKNTVKDIIFGYTGIPPHYNTYGITATRVYGNRLFPDPSCRIGRISKNIIIERNLVSGVHSWKSLDTHGGQDITFKSNICLNSHIGIGVDKGGFNPLSGFAPPRNIIIEGNTIRYDPELKGFEARAGITCFAHDNNPLNLGSDILVVDNDVYGYGTSRRDGAITISNIRNAKILRNRINNSLRSAICIYGYCDNIAIEGNVIKTIRKSQFNISYGIIFQTSLASGIVCNNVIIQESTRRPLTANVAVRNYSTQYQTKVCKENQFTGPANRGLVIYQKPQ